MSSIRNIAPSSNDISSEESGWTMYLEDFFNNQKCSMSLSSSLVSDAASLPAKNLADIEKAEEFSVMNKNGQKSSFKKRKNIITALVDDALEDTASSTLNSPKVLYANQFKNPEEEEEVNLCQEKGNTPGQRNEQKEMSFNGKDGDCTELKKRGLCVGKCLHNFPPL